MATEKSVARKRQRLTDWRKVGKKQRVLISALGQPGMMVEDLVDGARCKLSRRDLGHVIG